MKSSKKVIQMRLNEMIHLLRKNGEMDVNELAERLNVTTATIRRDLNQLEQEGYVRRKFGMAVYNAPDNMLEIEPTNIEDEKKLIRRRIAKAAAELVEEGDVIFMNSSGTASLVLEYLGEKQVTILTNNARIINREYPANVDVIMVGGQLYGKKQSLIGQFALDTISRVVASKCIFGCSGISAEGGITSVILPETQVNVRMMQQCNGSIIVVADGSKVGITQNFYSGSVREVTHLITDTSADAQGVASIQAMGVNVIQV